jgi:hypothetical protein
MPMLNGLEATRQVIKALPATKVLIMSAHDDLAYRLWNETGRRAQSGRRFCDAFDQTGPSSVARKSPVCRALIVR